MSEMRGMLEAVRDITLALNDNDMKVAARAVAGKGIEQAMSGTPLTIMVKSPKAFRDLGMAMHQGFTDIGAAAQNGAGGDKVLSMLGEQLGRCVACHGTYSLPR